MYRDRVADTVKGIQNKCLSREQMRKDREDEGGKEGGGPEKIPSSLSPILSLLRTDHFPRRFLALPVLARSPGLKAL